MKSKSLLYNVYLILVFIATSFAIAMRISAAFTDMNFSTGYFGDNSLINAGNNTVVVACILAFSYFFTESKDKKLIFNFSSPLNYVFAGPLALALLFFSKRAFTIFSECRARLIGNAGCFGYNPSLDRMIAVIAILLGLLSLSSVLHFILAGLIVKKDSERRADFGLVTVAFLALYSAYLYFSRDLPINAPSKIVDQSAYIVSALFFHYETRISIGRERWRAYRVFGILAMMLTAYSSIPSLIVYFANGAVISNSIEESVLTFTLLLFIGARLILTATLKENKEAKAATLIKNAFLTRQSEIDGNITEYAAESDEDLQGLALEDKGDYYELNFENSVEERNEESGDAGVEENFSN